MDSAELPKYVSRDTDRHGNVRYYYRRDGRKIRLRGEPTNRDFLACIPSALKQASKVKSFVYFILYGNSKVKIGTCANIKARLAGLKTGIPGKARVHYMTPGSYALERELHQRFAEDRVSGEWFRYSRPIREWIAQDDKRRREERGWA